jgi:hypothetical protein
MTTLGTGLIVIGDRVGLRRAHPVVSAGIAYAGERGTAMQDMLAHLEKLRVQVAECEMIRDLATGPAKRELFTKLADHYKVLAAEVQRAINERQARGSE